MIDKQQFKPVIIFVLKFLIIYAKYFENSVPKLFSNDGMNMFNLIKKIISFPQMEHLHRYNFNSQPALQLNLTTLCTCVILNLLLLE